MSLATTMVRDDQKLAAIQHVLEMARKGSCELSQPDVVALKAVALEIRGRAPAVACETLDELDRQLDLVLRSKGALGYDDSRLRGLAGIIIRRWPTIRAALLIFGGRDQS